MFNSEEFNNQHAKDSPKEILRGAFDSFNSIAISFSGAEDVVLIDLALKVKPNIQVFAIDTGRLCSETYEFIEKVRLHYNIDIEILYPDAQAVARLTSAKGLFSFYKDGHQECCGIRKVEPLRKKLAELDAWITGQRKDQSPGTRQRLDISEIDNSFSSSDKKLIKFNPLANWSSQEVWDYIRAFDVPYNTLHQQGYTSIGCQPCTRPVLPGQHEREGRWWWEDTAHKECGLHQTNIQTKD